MHSEFRRRPVERRERARHAKRLGDIQPVNDSYVSPVVLKDSATTTTSTTQTPSASAAKSTTATTPTTTSSAPTTTPSTTTSSSQAKTSSAVSSSASLSSSASQTLTSSASLSASLSTPSTTSSTGSPIISFSNTFTSQSVALTTTPTPTSINASATSNQLSGGALGGIIAASAIVFLALLIFIIRKTYLRRRQTRRTSVSWPDGGVFNDAKPLPAAPVEDSSSVKPSSVRNAPASPFDTFTRPIYAGPPQPQVQNMQSQIPFMGYAAPAPPNPSYNNPMPTYSGYPTVNPRNSNAVVSMARAAAGVVNSYPTSAPRLQANEEAFVNRVFIPSLPDELSVTVGERTRVLALYDDGWALCANGRGEQGMIPQECLDQRAASDEGDNRNARRSSSLNPDGRRY